VARKDPRRNRAPYPGTCKVCGTEGVIAKDLCRRCYQRTWTQARRAADPEYGPAQVARNAVRSKENREAIQAAKNRPCADCGGTFPQECMDFDHIDERGPKLFNLSNSGTRRLEAVLAEIAKCDVICANCHRVRTCNRRDDRQRCQETHQPEAA
jgi:hypothetical protein